MDNGKENEIEGKAPRRASRRLSILKDSPSREPLGNVTANHRRSNRRVSFADTKTIKEFLETVGNTTEWNSTYEAAATIDDTSSSMDITCAADRSSRREDQIVTQPPSAPSRSQCDSNKYEVSPDDSLNSSNFLTDFLQWEPSKSSSSFICDPEELLTEEGSGSPTVDEFLISFGSIGGNSRPSESVEHEEEKSSSVESTRGVYVESEIKDIHITSEKQHLLADDVAQQMLADLEMTCSQDGYSKKIHYPDTNLTQKIVADMDISCPIDQISKTPQKNVTHEAITEIYPSGQNNVTQKINSDMEITYPANQISNMIQSDITQKMNADMEMTCPVSQISKLAQSGVTPQINVDMNITSHTNQMSKQSHSDVTQKLNADMEMTCPANQMSNWIQSDIHKSNVATETNPKDMTQKLNADMEMTCPGIQISNLIHSDITQKMNADMEMTCPLGQISKLAQSNVTAHMNPDMEITCPVSQMSELAQRDITQKIKTGTEITYQSDITQKVNANMEMTCPADQISIFAQSDVIQKKNKGIDITYQSDMTQNVNTDMEMTCPANQISKLAQSDMIQKVNTDMEMICPAGQVSKLAQSDAIQKISEGTEITYQSDMTQKVNPDMEMTCPAGQIPKLAQSDAIQKVIEGTEITYQSDMTQKVNTDMEMTCPAGQISKLAQSDAIQKISEGTEITYQSDMTQKLNTDMEMTCPAGQIPKLAQNNVTPQINPDMEMTCPAGQVSKLAQSDVTPQINPDMEMTCPAGQVSKLAQSDAIQKVIEGTEITYQSDMTQKVNPDMEMTCPASQISKLAQSDVTPQINPDMEMTCPAGQVSKLAQSDAIQKVIEGTEITYQSDMTQKVNTDMEMTCPASQISKLSQSDVTPQINPDMEITCPAGQISKLAQSDAIQKISEGTEITYQSDMTQKLNTDMKMTCPAGQIPKLAQNNVTPQINPDMEMTCPAGQVSKLAQSDVTPQINPDMEMTCPAGQVSKLAQSDAIQKVIEGTEITYQSDMTQKVNPDMEMTCPASQISKLAQSDVTPQINPDMEMTCPAVQIPKLAQNDVTPQINPDMEITWPAGQVSKLAQSDVTPQINPDMEITCPAGQIPKLAQSDAIQKVIEGTEITYQSDMTQKVNTDMEMTCPAGQISRLSQSDVASQMNPEKEVTNPTNLMSKVVENHRIPISSRIISQGRDDGSANINCEDFLDRNDRSGLINQLCAMELTHSFTQTLEATDCAKGEFHKASASVATAIISDESEKENQDIDSASPCPSISNFMNIEEKRSLAHMSRTCPSNLVTEMIMKMSQRKSFSGTSSSSMTSLFTDNGSSDDVGDLEVSRKKSGSPQSPDSSDKNGTNNLLSTCSNLLKRKSNDNLTSDKPIVKRKSVSRGDTKESMASSDDDNLIFDGFQSYLENADTSDDHQRDQLSNKTGYKEVCAGDKSSEEFQRSGEKRPHDEDCHSTDYPPKVFVGTSGPKPVTPLITYVEEREDSSPSAEDELKLELSLTEPVTRLSSLDNVPSHDIPDISIRAESNVAGSDEEVPQLHLKTPVKELGENSTTQGDTDAQISVEYKEDISSKKNTSNEEFLEDIDIVFENSINMSLESLPSANKTLFEDVAADALSSISPLLTSFKRRVSEMHESRIMLERSMEQEEEEEEEKKASEMQSEDEMQNENTGRMSILQLSQSLIDIRKELLEESMVNNLPEEKDTLKSYIGSQNFNSTVCEEESSEKNVDGQMNVSVPENVSQNISHVISIKQEDSVMKDQEVDVRTTENLKLVPQIQESIAEMPLTPKDAAGENMKLQMSKENHKGVSLSASVENTLGLLPVIEDTCHFCCGVDTQDFLRTLNGLSKWIVKDQSEGVRYLSLQHTRLELALNVTRTDIHWSITTATWKPQVSDLRNGDSQLAMKLLGCRISAAVLKLYGLAVCEIGDILDKIAAAYEDVSSLLLELKVVQTAFLTEVGKDRIIANLFSMHHRVNAIVTINLCPPDPTPDQPYTLTVASEVTIGNLRNQLIKRAIDDVGEGPKYILRLLRAADKIIHS